LISRRFAIALCWLAACGGGRIVHPQPGKADCIEMYGSCSDGADRVCSSGAFVLSCGEKGRHPVSHEWVRCSCP
jgi:hypothetical protein